MLAVAPDEDLDPILVLTLLEGRRRLASDVLALEEELRKGPLRAEEGFLVLEGAHELLPRRLI